jgi:hypothetical protein
VAAATTEGDEVVVAFLPNGMGKFYCVRMLAESENRVPHLRRSFFAPKVGYRAEHDPFSRDGECRDFRCRENGPP